MRGLGWPDVWDPKYRERSLALEFCRDDPQKGVSLEVLIVYCTDFFLVHYFVSLQWRGVSDLYASRKPKTALVVGRLID